MVRSRTGCLTCRKRKLKCDEGRPVCGQCQKANRDCEPSTGLTFRHQHNASINADPDASPTTQSLESFYNYRKAFDQSMIWVEIPKGDHRFINTTNPYEDPPSPELEARALAQEQLLHPLAIAQQARRHMERLHPHGLEMLSEAAVFSPQQAESRRSEAHADTMVGRMDSPIDPNLASPAEASHMSNATIPTTESSVMPEPTSDHQEAFLLRHFSELPGKWMDIFDSGDYFSSHVPVQARLFPVLRHSLCAYAAKQLFLAQTQKAIVGGVTTRQATMESFEPFTTWDLVASYHYGEAVSILQGLLVAATDYSNADGSNGFEFRDPSDAFGSRSAEKTKQRLQLEEAVAATTILGVYEFVSATGTAWSRHLDGTKILLDIAGPQRRVDALSVSVPRDLTPSEGWRAIFWQLARQDYLAAFINECRTRLNTEDVELWRTFGLSLNQEGLVVKSAETQVLQDCMFANGLVWIASKICNYLAAGEKFESAPPGDRSQTSYFDRHPGQVAKSQAALLEEWNRLQFELDHWFQELPMSFSPSARIKPSEQIFLEHERLTQMTDKKRKFEEIWFPKTLCASTMQHYHMAQILLLLNKPHETTAGRTTLARRWGSYLAITEECVRHCYEIIGISLARPDAAARIHGTQPLFVAGQCLTNHRERKIIIDLLQGIESDLGWSTANRVADLHREWNATAQDSGTPPVNAKPKFPNR